MRSQFQNQTTANGRNRTIVPVGDRGGVQVMLQLLDAVSVEEVEGDGDGVNDEEAVMEAVCLNVVVTVEMQIHDTDVIHLKEAKRYRLE